MFRKGKSFLAYNKIKNTRMKRNLLLFAIMAMLVMPMLATTPTNVKRPNGIKVPLKKVPTTTIGYTPEIKPYSLDGLFDYEVIQSSNTLWILVQENVGTTQVHIECAEGIVYETTESVFAGDVLEISLADWQAGEYILRLQNKENIVQGEFAL
ncbi:MAG TPA: hypothetical protein DEQ84_00810 [Prevotellaceae bacterium]|nr:hypothetical protein [Prevotellaceae bacterium]